MQVARTPDSTALVAHTGNSFACISQTPLVPWVLDSVAFGDISGNRSLFASLSTAGQLPSMASADGAQTP